MCPNWCTNRLTVTGPKEAVEALLDRAQGEDFRGNGSKFSFHRFVPMPNDTFQGSIGPEEKAKYPGDKNWYDWCCNHWDTKWDANDVRISKEGDEVFIGFSTAWSPSRSVTKAMAEQFTATQIVHDYVEEGMGYAGRDTYKNGRRVEAEEADDSSGPLYEKIYTSLYGEEGWAEHCANLEEEEE